MQSSKSPPDPNSPSMLHRPNDKITILQFPTKLIWDNLQINSTPIMIKFNIAESTPIQINILLKITKTINYSQDPIQHPLKIPTHQKLEILPLLIAFLPPKCGLQLPNQTISSKKVIYLLMIVHSWLESQPSHLTLCNTETKK